MSSALWYCEFSTAAFLTKRKRVCDGIASFMRLSASTEQHRSCAHPSFRSESIIPKFITTNSNTVRNKSAQNPPFYSGKKHK